MLTVLEMALREVLARAGARGARASARRPSVPEAMRRACARSTPSSTGERLRGDLARLVEAEEQVYRRGARTSYFADSLAVDVLTDTTERSPTFCTPSFRKWDDEEASESWAFLFTPAPTTRGGLDDGSSGASRRRSSGRRRTCARSSTRRPPRSRAAILRRDRPARADALPDRPRRPRLPPGARRRRRHGRGGGEGPSAAGGRAAPSPRELARAREAGAYGGGDRRGPGGRRSRGSPRRPRPAEATG